MATQNNDIYIQIDHEKIKLEGQAKVDFLSEVAKRNAETEAEKAKALADKLAATAKLAALGLTVEDLQALGLQHNLEELCLNEALPIKSSCATA